MSRRAAVVGSPVAHSLSPLIHRTAYAHLGLDWTYDRVEVTEAEFGAFVRGCDESWAGLSVTMPNKGAAARCGAADEDVTLTGVANTVVLGPDRRVFNTDLGGFTDALAAAGESRVHEATVLGNGATARSAVVALTRLGARVIGVQGRDISNVDALRDWAESHLDVEIQPRSWGAPLDPATEVLISTAPAAPVEHGLRSLALDVCPDLRTVFDVIYDPWPTPLAEAAERAGLTVVDGLDLLVHQAARQVHLMTSRQVPTDVLMSAVRARPDAARSA